MENNVKKRIFMTAICLILTVCITTGIFFLRQNYLYAFRDRLIILAYQTNIAGADGEKWAEELKKQFPSVPDFEVSVFLSNQVGNEQITITQGQSGWSQIATRLGASQGDILLVDNEIFYSVLLKNNMLVPLDDAFSEGIYDFDGNIYGIDVTNCKTEGLINLGTSEFVGLGQPLPIMPAEEGTFALDGISIEARVIAVIYKGSKRIEDSKQVLKAIVGDNI